MDANNSPWAAGDEYDPQLHGQPEQHAPAAQRGYAFALSLSIAVIILSLCLIVAAAVAA